MENIQRLEDGFRRAFALAYFIHGEKAVSLEIATGALAKLEVTATAQAKRLYYSPARSSAARIKGVPLRTKVSLDDLPLLQRLVYIESEHCERRSETESGPFARSLSRDDLVVRFIKHLVQITVKRNSFYVALGLGRLLHNYTTAEVIRIHDALLADPSRAKGEDYFRARKALLLQELKNRFGRLLTTTHREHGEERFHAELATEESALLAAQCLNRFTPWSTSCPPGPEDIHHRRGDENRIEVNQMHVVLHPNCYRRLTDALGLDPPDKRLEIPRFSRSDNSDENSPRGDRQSPPDITGHELTAVAEHLAAESTRRKRLSAGLLRIFVDGDELGRLDPTTDSSLQVEVGKEAELIEVRGRDQNRDVLLATHLLGQEREVGTPTVTLEAGQRISFAVRRRPVAESPGSSGIFVDVRYRETTPIRAISLIASRMGRLAQTSSALRPAVSLTVLILLAIGLGVSLRWLAPAPSSQQVVIQNEPTPIAKGQIPAANPSQPQAPLAAKGKTRKPESLVAGRLPRPDQSPEGESTRGIEQASPEVTLASVKKIYVECTDREVRDAFLRRLAANGALIAVERREDAEAALRISTTPSTRESKRHDAIAVQLVGAAGNAIWPTAGKGTVRRYSGTSEDVASNAVQDLLKAVHSERRKP